MKALEKTAALAALVTTGVLAALVGAPSASAVPDSGYCQGLATAGYPGNCATLTDLAKDVCAQYDRGFDLDTIVDRLDGLTQDKGLSNYIMAGATVYFCPEYSSAN
jgi:hypothetical protein